jgi:hypothetical protein
MSGGAARTRFDRIAAFAGSTAAAGLVGAWALAEALVLPVVPDVALALLAAAAPRLAVRLSAAVLVGAISGSVVLAALTTAVPAQVDAMLRALPAIDSATIAAVDAEVAAEGVSAFAQLGPGPPLKVYTASWTAAGGNIPGLFVGVTINRLTRIGPVVFIAALAGWLAPGWLRRRERLVIPGYVLGWTAFYALYWGLS